MLLVTGATDSLFRDRGCFQDMPSEQTAKPFCKLSRYVTRPESLSQMVTEAISVSLSQRPGPVHLTIPADILDSEVSGASSHRMTVRTTDQNKIDGCNTESFEAAIDMLSKAKRPCVVAGSGVFYADGADALRGLVSELRSPLVVPIWDRGAIGETLPEYCGVVGSASGQPLFFSDVDVFLLVGAAVDYRIAYMEPPGISHKAKIIRIDADETQLYSGIAPDIALYGNPQVILDRLCNAMTRESPAKNDGWLKDVQRKTKSFYNSWHAAPAVIEEKTTGWHILEEIKKAVTDNTYVLVDGGNIGQWFHMRMFDRYPPNWLTCGRSGVVGWGLPAAAAVRSLRPEADVLLLSGDGASTFTIAEIETAVRQNLPYVAIIADDSAWGIVVSGSNKRSEEPVASKLGPIDYCKVAEGFGARAVRITDIGNLSACIQEGFDSKKVTILHVPMATLGPADTGKTG